MTNQVKKLIAGKLRAIANRQDWTEVERQAIIAGAAELSGNYNESDKHAPSEEQMKREGFEPWNLDAASKQKAIDHQKSNMANPGPGGTNR